MFPATAPKTYSILLADDLTLVREALVALCQARAGYRVVGQCSDGTTTLRLVDSTRPDIAILDLNLRDPSALEVVRKLRETQIHTRIVILATREDRRTAVEALRSGANALLLKSDSPDRLLEAFNQILDDGIYISPSFKIDKIFISSERHISSNPLEALSAREFQVFSLLVAGNRAKEVAVRLGLNAKTVDTYRANLMRKLDINTLVGLVRLAIECGVA